MKKLFINNFILKIILFITTTFLILGVCLSKYAFESQTMIDVGFVFECIGILSLPIFCFLLVESFLNTKSKKRYFFRLLIPAFIIFVFQVIIELLYVSDVIESVFRIYQGNIFITLILGLIMLYLFNHKNNWIKSLGILPIIYCLVSFCVNCFEYKYDAEIYWLIYFIRPEYDILAILYILVFFLSYKLLPLFYSFNGLNGQFYKDTPRYRFYLNGLSFAGLFLVSFIYYALIYVDSSIIYWDANMYLICIVSGIIILFYNGRRGYDNKIFRYVSYLSYPIFLIIINMIFYLAII